jgi:competence protein ComEC
MVLGTMTLTGVAAARRWEQRFPPCHVRYLESRGAELDDPVLLRGTVVSTPYRVGYGMQFDVEAERIKSGGRTYPVTGKIRFRVQGTDERVDANGNRHEIEFGDVVEATTRLRHPNVYQNPGSFDFRQWMEDIEDLYWVGTVKNPHQIERLGRAPGLQFSTLVEHTRQRLLRGIDDIYPPWSAEGRNGAVLKAVLWGDRTALDSTTIDDFRKTGLYHLLVIAGLHIGLLTLILDTLLRWLGFRRLSRALIVICLLAVYALLVEQRAPTLRATLMISLYLLARILDRGHSPLNSLGGVALILLYYRPAWLFESGFQLSFSAVLLIVGVAVPILERTTEPYQRALQRLDDVLLDDYFPPRLAQTRLDLRALVNALRRRVQFFGRFPALSRNLIVAPMRIVFWTANIVMFSAVLQLGLMLPMVEIFHRVTFAGVGLNALAIPVMTVLLALALPINLLSVASPALAVWPAKVLTVVMGLLFEMTHLPRMAAWLSYRVPVPPLWVASGFCAAFLLTGLALRFRHRAVGVTLAACLIFVGLLAIDPFAPRLPEGALELTSLDCGKGEALFLVFPGGGTMLVNAGGNSLQSRGQRRRWTAGEDIVSPYLWSRGVNRIDVVVSTGSSGGDLAGIEAIIEDFQVGEFWHSTQPVTPEFATLLNAIAEREIPTRTLVVGDELSFSGASIHVALPNTGGSIDDPLILEVNARQLRFLLPQDIDGGAENERVLVGQWMTSQSSNVADKEGKPSAFIPRIAILSSGIVTDPGADPLKSDLLGERKNLGIRTFRTGLDGAVTVEWKDGSLVARTYKNPEDVPISTEGGGALFDAE